MTYPITISASGTYDIKPDFAAIGLITVTNSGAGVVYWGDIPIPDVYTSIPTAANGVNYVDAATESDAMDVEEGMILADGGTAWGAGVATVTKVVGKRIFLSTNSGSADNNATFRFSAPAISITNGHPILPGETVNWTSGPGGMINQRGRRLVADASGVSLSITKRRN